MSLTHSPEIDKLATALAKAQGTVEDALKDSLNPHFKSAYADLASVRAAIRKPLAENGISYVQFPEANGNQVSCETMLMHDSGQWIRGTLTMQAANPTPQGIGSAITYCRRYSLMAAVGIAPSEDDDGNQASSRSYPTEQYTAQSVATPRPVTTSGNGASRQASATPFDEAPSREPVAGAKGIAMAREVKGCKSLDDLEALKRTPEFAAFWKAANEADRAEVMKAVDRLKSLYAADLIAAE